jgi:toxin-antitoxin system, toxin component, Txe/YoeB family
MAEEIYSVVIQNSAKSDLKKVKTSNLKGEFLRLVNTLKEDPYKQSDGFEKLFPRQAGFYSRRMNIQHRVVYKIDDEKKIVTIYSAWTHYEKGNLP